MLVLLVSFFFLFPFLWEGAKEFQNRGEANKTFKKSIFSPLLLMSSANYNKNDLTKTTSALLYEMLHIKVSLQFN